MSQCHKSESSFRDPCGFIFSQEKQIYRQVNLVGKRDYELLMSSGLYKELSTAGLLICHEETELKSQIEPDKFYKIIKPEQLNFISYPYEWSFSQLQDAALATLAIQKRAFKHGMTLKDASAYNIQFKNCNPMFIDTLSLEAYTPGRPWQAYRQFCQHFLAPLALMSYCDIRLGLMSQSHIDGIPLDLAARLLPGRSLFNIGILTHIHLHARAQKRYAGNVNASQIIKERKISQLGFQGIIESLESTVRKLRCQTNNTEWGDYYNNTNYDDLALSNKKQLVKNYLEQVSPDQVWDLGANTGEFSRVAVALGIETVAFDIDPAAVEANYQQGKKNKEAILPL
ncbi:MAG: hypothetical protein JW745_07820, partial [Sedimentisphaerales bacterium]|nr:hypothetical protein [Sedimentisphaerales bacterium]